MAYQIVPENSLSPYRVQDAQSATTQLRLLEVSSFHQSQVPIAVEPDAAMPMSQPSGAVALHSQPHINNAFR